MNFIDIINEDGEVVGQQDKDLVHQLGSWHRAVHIWIINNKREILIQKRSPNVDAYPNLWDFSCGGHVDADEDLLTCAQRETQEELGLTDVLSLKFVFLFDFKDSFTLNGGKYINNEIDSVYLVSLDSSNLKISMQTEELSQIEWVNYQELEKRIIEHPEGFVPRLYEYQKFFKYLMTYFVEHSVK
ncbi:MAG: hypothetical protein ACD_19C00067G0005 [uncultured bacterium]|nr:MAG: hypothetical protein ACD_19C00067G0005 [uncultured bacterium]